MAQYIIFLLYHYTDAGRDVSVAPYGPRLTSARSGSPPAMNRPNQTLPMILSFTLVLTACGSSPTAITTPLDPPPPPPPQASMSVVEQVTTLDLAQLDDYTLALPAYYLTQQVSRLDNSRINPTTDAGATLGRVLFHDAQLSINNTVSCASCHIRDEGFTDPDQFSTGFDGIGKTGAHSMRLANIRWYDGSGFFWDKRAATVEDQALQPIQNSVEMGFDSENGGLTALTAKLNGLDYYRLG